MKLPDSGARRQFDTGAVRDIQEGKGRCDLLPLCVIAGHLNDAVLFDIADFMEDGDYDHLYAALDHFFKVRGENKEYIEKTWADRMLEVSKHYEDGAAKYGDRNWEKGIPLHCFIDSGVRHYLKLKRGDTDEPHDRAFVWNVLGAIWTMMTYPSMCDIPSTQLKGENSNAE